MYHESCKYNEKLEKRYRVGLINDGGRHLKVGEVDRQWKSRVIGERKVEVRLKIIALWTLLWVENSYKYNQ